MSTDMREKLIVALDVPTVAAAESLVWKLGDDAVFYKIGYQLAFAGGLALARDLARSGKRVFLDMKLHDIGNTVARGIENIATMGVDIVTVHAYPQTMRAAREGRGGASLKIVAVTVLTSCDDADLAEAGYAHPVKDLVALRAAQARDIGIDGLVASPGEAAIVRGIVGPAGLVVTPGVRPAGSAAGDQKRVATPAAAIAAGASHLVVGRPILEVADPAAAARAIVAEIEQASRIAR